MVQQFLVHELDEERAQLKQLHAQALGVLPFSPKPFVHQATHLENEERIARNDNEKTNNE